jgi:hypothetical protein
MTINTPHRVAVGEPLCAPLSGKHGAGGFGTAVVDLLGGWICQAGRGARSGQAAGFGWGQGGGSLLVRGSSCGAARRPRGAGTADTTAGSLRDASARSITAMRVGSASPSMGVVITRDDVAPQLGHGIVAGAVPIGLRTSTGPSTVHR